MNKRIYFFIALLITICNPSSIFSQQTTIKGCAKEYANKKIDIYRYADYLTKNEEKIGTFSVDSVGNFNYSFNCHTTHEIYMYLGIYKAFMFVQPNKEFELVMPPFEEKTLEDGLSPFYEPTDISIGIINNPDPHELNMLILSYNAIYDSFCKHKFSMDI
jgi:hypothetical protein